MSHTGETRHLLVRGVFRRNEKPLEAACSAGSQTQVLELLAHDHAWYADERLWHTQSQVHKNSGKVYLQQIEAPSKVHLQHHGSSEGLTTVLRSLESASVYKETCGYASKACNKGAEGRFSEEKI